MEERPRFELRQVKSDGTEKIELCSLEEVLKQVGEISMGRRKILGISAIVGSTFLLPSGILINKAGKLFTRSTPTPSPTSTPTPSPKPTSTPSPKPQTTTYKLTDEFGIGRTYTLPCGSPIPPGAICTCNCV